MAVVAKFFDANGTGINAEVPGNRFSGFVEITIGTTYLTNGLTVAALCVGLPLKTITKFVPIVLGATLDGTVNDLSFDRANQKVKFYAGTTEVTNAVDLSAYTLIAFVEGLR